MATELKELKEKHLWPHQVRAVEMIGRYLKARRSKAAAGSALVRFPTGTGKTAVIAVAARLLAGPGTVVVVCPSEALREQLRKEIHSRFWEKLGVDPPGGSIVVETFLPKNIAERMDHDAKRRCVLVGTAQALAQIHRKQPSDFKVLMERTRLLIFDEGHREPARRWGEAARALACPSVLFSATPYRNDYALFDIESKHVESLGFHDALKQKCIRDVEVREQNLGAPDALAAHLSGLLAKLDSEARAIVRCASRDSVLHVTTALRAQSVEAIGIHHRFESGSPDHLRRTVPAPEGEAARVWVHQDKLLEGIDDPRFAVVVVYEPFGNARSLVQQVGRVIRNPCRKKAKPALLVVDPASGQGEYWNRYLEFERAFDPTRHDVRDLISQAIADQPKYRYLARSFRRIFDPTEDDFHTRLAVPAAANIYVAPSPLDPERMRAEIIAEWEQGERIILNSVVLPDESIVVLYAEARNSPVLLQDYYIEDRLGFTVIHPVGDWIFYQDTGGALSAAVRKACPEVDPRKMHALFGKDTRAVSLSMRNTDLGRHAFRRRTVHAYSLAEAATGLSDHGYFCSTAQGYERGTGGSLRRYVGVARSRITESCPPNHGLSDFKSWAADKATALGSAKSKAKPKSHALFDRFAAPTRVPSKTTPVHLLLDVVDLVERDAYRTATGGTPLEIEDLAVPVAGGSCTIVANDQPYSVEVKYADGHYRLAAPQLDNAYVLHDPSGRFRRGLIAHANVEHAFRVVPKAGWTIYAHGHFVAPSIQVGDQGDGPDITRVLTAVPALGATKSEKGAAGSASKSGGWCSSSVFGVFDRCALGLHPRHADDLIDATKGFDIVVCDDMHKEAADFFCADTKMGRVVLVHAKWKKSKLSASALHEVCSQAVKNLDLLQPFARRDPPNLKLWDQDWTANYGKTGPIGVVGRLRLGPGDGKKCWEEMKALVQSPNTTREVWLLLGKTFDIKSLKDEQRKKSPKPEAVQIYYQLQSTWTAVSAIGARFRVFAS